MTNCVFCKIGRRELEAMVVYEDNELIAFRDINPQAPVHILIIPKAHYETLNEIRPEHAELVGRMVVATIQIARQEKLGDRGFRLVLNNGDEAGQTVRHVHLHLIGGRTMNWPPG